MCNFQVLASAVKDAVMGKSQIKSYYQISNHSEIDLNHLAKSQIPFFLKSQVF